MEIIESLYVGDYRIVQDTEEYRFTSDSVLLARFLKAKKGERVADFCAGNGVVGLHFFAENSCAKEVTFFEMRERPAELCAKSIILNAVEDRCRVERVRLQEIPAKYVEYFSLILCNPPYGSGGIVSPSDILALSKNGLGLSHAEMCEAAKKCLKFGGRFAFIHRADKLCDLITSLRANNLEPKKLQFVAGAPGRKPYAVLILAVKGGKAGLEVLPTAVNQKEKT